MLILPQLQSLIIAISITKPFLSLLLSGWLARPFTSAPLGRNASCIQNMGRSSKGSMFNLLERSICPRLPQADWGNIVLPNFPDRGQGPGVSSCDDQDPLQDHQYTWSHSSYSVGKNLVQKMVIRKVEFRICNTGKCVIHLSSYPNQWKAVKPFIVSLLLFPLPGVCHGPSTVTPGRVGGVAWSSARCYGADSQEEHSSVNTGRQLQQEGKLLSPENTV